MAKFRAVALAALALAATAACAGGRTRLIVMTDISTLTAEGGEPDDTQSLVRLLLYANDFDIEGMIATATGAGDVVHPEFIRAVVGEYGKVRDNLALHDPRYPPAAELLDRVKAGYAGPPAAAGARRRDAKLEPGPGRDSEGSRWIVAAADRPDPRPLWIIVWGGTMDLAQALWSVSNGRGPGAAAAFKSGIRVYAIDDQDSTASWIRKTHPDLFYIAALKSFRGMYRDGDASLATPEWVEEHVRRDHGPLGAAYPNYNGGDPWGKVKGIKEGDTPSLLYLVPNGLGEPQQPGWGSWGGRFSGSGPQYRDAQDTVGGQTGERVPVFRWREAYQASFQARLDWCVKPFDQANHEPVAALEGKPDRTAAAGTWVELSAAGSSDPDGQKLSYRWMAYPEAGTYEGAVTIQGADTAAARFQAPSVDAPKTLHIVLAVTDNGSPPLTSYRRVVVTVRP